jgi:hypothetical protein
VSSTENWIQTCLMAYFSCGITYCEQDKTSRCQTAYPRISHSAWRIPNSRRAVRLQHLGCWWWSWIHLQLILFHCADDLQIPENRITNSGFFRIIWSHRCFRLNNVSLMRVAGRMNGCKRSDECTDSYSSRSLICFAFFHSISLYPRQTFRSNHLVVIEGNGLILKMILFHGNMVRSIMDYLAWIWAWYNSAVKSVLDFVLSAWKIVFWRGIYFDIKIFFYHL